MFVRALHVLPLAMHVFGDMQGPRTANVCLSLSAAMGQGKTALMQVVRNSAEAYGIETFFARARLSYCNCEFLC